MFDRRILLWGGEVTRSVLSFAIVAALAREVMPDVLGTYLSVTSIILLLPRLLDCGLPHALGYFLRLNPASARSAGGLVLRHVFGAAPVAFGLAFSMRFIPFASDGASAVVVHYWPLLGALILSELMIILALASFVPTGRFGSYALTALSPSSLLIAAVLFWPVSDLSAHRILELLVTTSIAGAIIAVCMLFRAKVGPASSAPFPVIQAYSYGLRSYGSAIAKMVAQRFDRLFLVTVLGAAGYGQYSLAVSIRDAAILPSSMYGLTLRNRQIDLLAKERNLAAGRRLLIRVTAIWLLLGLGAAAVLLPLWPTIIRTAFGTKFEQTAHFMQVLAFSCGPLAVMGFSWNHLYSLERPGRVTLLTVGSLATIIPCFLLLIAMMGPSDGVADAVLIWSMVVAAASISVALISRPPQERKGAA